MSTPNTEVLPILYVRASNHHDAGLAIGAAFKVWIKEYLETSRDVILYRKFHATPYGKRIVSRYLETAEIYHPNIVAEIRGLASGAGQDFMDVFMLQIASEIQFCHAHKIPGLVQSANLAAAKETIAKGCTDILLNGKDHRILAHNDDWYLDVADRVFMVNVSIHDKGVREKYVAFTYPGYLPGFCFWMNKQLAVSLNSVCPKTANENGVPMAILARALLACSSIHECVDVISCRPVGCAYGMTFNMAEINGSRMCSMEVYTDSNGSRVHMKEVIAESSGSACHYYHHQNVYLHTDGVDETDAEVASSKRREERIKQMRVPTCVNDVISILSDDSIFEDPRKQTANTTMTATNTSAMAVFNLKEKSLTVYRSNPSSAKGPLIVLPFL